MLSTNELLKSHPLYGLDRAIADYLAPVLEQKFPELFCRYRELEDALTTAAVEATAQLGQELIGRELTLQEEVLSTPNPGPGLSQAWCALLDAAEDQWQDLCQLYGSVLTELRDLEIMATAQQAAQHSGNSSHTALVRDLLGLDSTLAPAWVA